MHKKKVTTIRIEMYKYRAKIIRVIDSSTFQADVDLGFNITVSHRFHLMGINTPETWKLKTKTEKEYGERAIRYVKDLIEGKTVLIETFKVDIYNKYETIVILQDGRKLSDILKEQKRNSYGDCLDDSI